MSRRNASELAFSSIRIEGGLLDAGFLDKVARELAPEQSAADYKIPRGLQLRDEVARYWKIGLNLWQDFNSRRTREGVEEHRLTAYDFLEPFCRDVLDFNDIEHIGQVTLNERIFPIGWQASGGRVPLIFAAHNQRLEESHTRYGDGTKRRSAFLLGQEYLNAQEIALWAVVSNGLQLRILRDNPSMTRPAYIEIDLETIFNEELYAEFTAFWLLTHSSRFGTAGTPGAECPLERWRNVSQEDGVRARDMLRDGVADSLRALGTGFVSHPENQALRDKLQQGELKTQVLFEQLLRLVYRFIFLATVEDRQASDGRRLVFTPDATQEAMKLYEQGYSLTRLRALAAKRRHYDRHADLWQALGITFSGLGEGQAALGLPALGGLFSQDKCPDIESAQIENQYLLKAVFNLCFFRRDSVLSRVNYRDMDTEELGSVYESLLELVPQVDSTAGKFGFVGDEQDDASNRGNARKLTGSYYTPDSLVQELIKSALEPVIQQTLVDNPQRPEQALLEITVCDPACGSGHFLLAAARHIAEHLAKQRAADGNPTAADYRHALRDVVSHCIYGVDKNPMATELTRTALWLEAYTPDRPLTFLDHHIRCGDALLGVLDPKLMQAGIPAKAFDALSGDDKEVCKQLKKANGAALKSIERDRVNTERNLSLALEDLPADDVLESMPEENLADISAKKIAFDIREQSLEGSRAKGVADIFIAAFVMPKSADTLNATPTSQDLYLQLTTGQPRPGILRLAHRVAERAQAFHWWLEFPHIAKQGGFKVLLGNPPWERIKLQEEEFFATRSPWVAEAQHKAERATRIQALADAEEGTPERRLFEEFMMARRNAEASSLFAHDSGRYPLTGVGDVNTYALFAETFLGLLNEAGRAGFIVPTGIATDDSTKAYFEYISQNARLATLLAFENEEFIFPAVHHSFRFCILTLGKSDSAEFVFFARKATEVHDTRRRFTLAPEEFLLINPNTRTCPVFRSQQDAELTKKIYRNVPVLIKEGELDINPWGIRFMTMLHMSGDSGLFRNQNSPNLLPVYEAKLIHQYDHRWATYDANGESRDVTATEKISHAYCVTPRYWVEAREVFLRTTTLPKGLVSALRERNTSLILLGFTHLLFGTWLGRHSNWSVDVAFDSLFQFWKTFVDEQPFAATFKPTQLGLCGENPPCVKSLGSNYLPAESIGNIVSTGSQCTAWYATDKATVADYIQFASQFDGLFVDCPKLSTEQDAIDLVESCLEYTSPKWLMGWRDVTSAHVLRTTIATVIPRACVGHKMPLLFCKKAPSIKHVAALLGNLNSLVLDYVARLKVGGISLTYHYFRQFPVLPPERYSQQDLEFIVPRVLELTYTTDELKPWAEDLDYVGTPYSWKPEERALLRAELDAFYAKLYGLSRDELRYILDPSDVMGEDYPSETFRVLKNSEVREFGEYRTRRLVLEAWDKLTELENGRNA